MRLGGPVSDESCDPERWVADVKRRGYTAVPAPLQGGEPDAIVQAYVEAATAGGVLIAEVGAWSNPLSPDEATRKAALELCQERLALADAIGARCCVNIAGSRGEQWDGPHPDNLTEDIKSCHAKDIRLSGKLTVHLDEVRPGLGSLDYRTFLREIDKLDPDTPLLLEHLPSEEEYALAAGYVRSVAQEIGIAC
jgi:sugar phosphate isomerase/epimerase